MTPRYSFLALALAALAGCSLGALDGFSGGGPDANDGGASDASSSSDATSGGDAATDGSSDADAPTTCTDLPGLLGHWTFDQASITGTKVADRSPAGAHGTLMGSGALTSTAGVIGEALQFSTGDPGWVRVPSVAFDDTAGAKNSFSFWFYRSSVGTADDALFYAPSSPRYDVWLKTQSGRDYLCVNAQGNECWGLQDDGLRGRWVHVVAVLHNGPITSSALWVDGQPRTLACQESAGFNPCTQSRTIGTPIVFGGENDYPFRGKMDDMRIYARSLTDGEIQTLYSRRACP